MLAYVPLVLMLEEKLVAKAPQSNRKCGNAANDTVEDQTK